MLKLKNTYDRYHFYAWVFIGVTVIIWAVFMLYPVIYSLVLSTKTCKGNVCEFVGFGNIRSMLKDPSFWNALKNSILFFVLQVPIMLILALIIASLLNGKDLKFRGFFRTAIFLPSVMSLVAYAVLFKMLLAPHGVINNLLIKTHIVNDPILWLRDPLFSKLAIILAITWRWTGYNMVFYLAALQSIPSELFEAADMDGASKIQKFTRITVPLLRPVILFTAIISTIGTIQLFDEPRNLTDGINATATLSVYIYNQSFLFVPNFGYAATVSYVVVLIVAILSFIQIKYAERGENEKAAY